MKKSIQGYLRELFITGHTSNTLFVKDIEREVNQSISSINDLMLNEKEIKSIICRFCFFERCNENVLKNEGICEKGLKLAKTIISEQREKMGG